MGLRDIAEVNQNDSRAESKYRRYGYHEYNSKLEGMVEELQSEFPVEIDCEFIEVSTEMTKTWAMAYFRPEGDYIRVSDRAIDKLSDDHIRRVVAHEMVHLYCRQKGYPDVSDNDGLFNWLLGMLGADVNGYSPDQKVWKDLAEPMIEHKEGE